jgi:hypothetical protein
MDNGPANHPSAQRAGRQPFGTPVPRRSLGGQASSEPRVLLRLPDLREMAEPAVPEARPKVVFFDQGHSPVRPPRPHTRARTPQLASRAKMFAAGIAALVVQTLVMMIFMHREVVEVAPLQSASPQALAPLAAPLPFEPATTEKHSPLPDMPHADVKPPASEAPAHSAVAVPLATERSPETASNNSREGEDSNSAEAAGKNAVQTAPWENWTAPATQPSLPPASNQSAANQPARVYSGPSLTAVHAESQRSRAAARLKGVIKKSTSETADERARSSLH